MNEKLTFKTGEEMLDRIINHSDLYNQQSGIYVSVYNDDGSIIYYTLDDEEVLELRKRQEEEHEYWSGFLGYGGHICDDPEYEGGNVDVTNLDFCNYAYTLGEWEVVGEF